MPNLSSLRVEKLFSQVYLVDIGELYLSCFARLIAVYIFCFDPDIFILIKGMSSIEEDMWSCQKSFLYL